MNNEHILKIAKDVGASEFKTGNYEFVLMQKVELMEFAKALQGDGEFCYTLEGLDSMRAGIYADVRRELQGDGEPVAEFKQFGKSGLQGSYCQFVFNPKFVKNCKEGDKVYAIPPDQTAKIKELQDKLDTDFPLLAKLLDENTKLQKQNDVMREALTRIALGNVYDAEIIELAGDTLVSINILGDK